MGKEWLNWIGGGGRGRRKSVDMVASSKCMCSVFQLFDFYHLNRRPHLDSHFSYMEDEDGDEEMLSTKGVEAPRNSLELSLQEEECLNFPVRIKIKTNHRRLSSSESISDSPGAKTPNLIARLMGLDLLPDCSSPSIHSSNSKFQVAGRRRFEDDAGVRSLLETPRISTGRISDVECHRLSLQINKVNTYAGDFDFPSLRRVNVARNENVNPGRNGKRNLHREKSRSFDGVDITNTRRNRDLVRIDEHLVIKKWNKDFRDGGADKPPENGVPTRIKPKISPEKAALLKPRNIVSEEISYGNKNLYAKPLTNKSSSCSLKENSIHCNYILSMYQEKKKISTDPGSKSQRIASVSPGLVEQRNSKKIGFLISEKSNTDEDQPFPISPPRYVSRALSQKQSQVSEAVSSQSCTQFSSTASRMYKLSPGKISKTEIKNCSGYSTTRAYPGSAPAGVEDYDDCITKILQRSDYKNYATVFYRLEQFNPVTSNTVSSHRHWCRDKKLIFQLLKETQKTQHSLESEITSLIEVVCKKIDSLCAARYDVVEEIDLVMKSEMNKTRFCGLMEEEDDGIVVEIEREIFERLVIETAAVVSGGLAE